LFVGRIIYYICKGELVGMKELMKNLVKKSPLMSVIVLSLVISAAFVLVNGTVWAAGPKGNVGYIDMELIQSSLQEFKDFQTMTKNKDAELNSFVQYIQTQFTNTRSSLEKERDEKKQGKGAEEQKKIDNEYNELLKQALEENQQKLEGERARLTAEIQREYDKVMEKVQAVVEQVANEAGVSIVLEKRLVFYGGVDLTEQVLAEAQKAK